MHLEHFGQVYPFHFRMRTDEADVILGEPDLPMVLTFWTFMLPCTMPTLPHLVPHIVRLGAEEEVRRAEASRIVTVMAYKESFRMGPTCTIQESRWVA